MSVAIVTGGLMATAFQPHQEVFGFFATLGLALTAALAIAEVTRTW